MIRMGCEVDLADLRTGLRRTVRLVGPRAALAGAEAVSLFSPLGRALVALSASGQHVATVPSWPPSALRVEAVRAGAAPGSQGR